MGYPFRPLDLRAQCLNVLDGDTILALIDKGEYEYVKRKIRLSRINAYELTSKDPDEVTKAVKGKDFVIQWLSPNLSINVDEWPLRILMQKNADEYGRTLAEVYFILGGKEHNAGDELLKLGLAVPYKK
jgi:endonuclease YncB( thermonuclease family)